MTPRKQMVLKARNTCPICESAAQIEPLNKTREGNTRMSCRACGYVFEVPTEGK